MSHPTSPLAQLFRQYPLYAIWDTSLRSGLSGAAVLEAWLLAGIKVIQYRHKRPFRRANFEECVAMSERVRELGGVFFVNDRPDVAELCGAGGVHLGEGDLPVEKARAFLAPERIIGYSTHNVGQARLAAALPVDYIAIGPVFPTATKEIPDPVVGLETVSQVRSVTAKPLVAIGGITIDNASSVLRAGADAVAVISDLIQADNIESRARDFLAVLKSLARPWAFPEANPRH
ncbi:MAG: thiamine phosphate synthase [Acidobacteria bacterium]|nr:thiamine phosphate synthase [Acidobacteriota bacterium]